MIENENILKLLGIVFVYLCVFIVVCKIDKIVEKFNFEIVRYREEEFMDCI